MLSSPFAVAQGEGAQAGGARALEEVIVTARKREERSQDVPLSLQSFSGDSLSENRTDNVEELIGTVPNLYASSNLLSPGKDFVNLVIRGIGAQSAGAPAVGTFVDGVYLPALSFDIGFLDVERAEILRGPQGTLFGRNTEGGALNIILRRPDERTQASAALTYDTFQTVRGQGSASGSLGKGLFATGAVDIESSEGFLRNRAVVESAGGGAGASATSADDYDRYAARLALRKVLESGTEFYLSADGSRRTGLDGLPGIPRGREDYVVESDFQIDALYENYGASFIVDYPLGIGALTAITGYRETSTRLPFDFDGSAEFTGNFHDLRSRQEILSEEVRLRGGDGGSFDWLLGLYGFSEKHLQERMFRLPAIEVFPMGLFVDAQTQSLRRRGVALYGDVTYEPWPRLELNAGLRYSYEDIRSSVDLDFQLPGLLVVDESGRDRIHDDEISPTASIRYKWLPDLMSYVRYARGYRAGGFPLAPASATTNISFLPELSDNYEIGLKGRLGSGAFEFDLAAFRIDISDQQLSTIVFLNGDPNLPVASVGNAGKSRSEGFEVQLTARPFTGLELRANVGRTEAKYERYIDTVGANRSGERFPFVPEWTAQFSAAYRFAVNSDMDLELYGAYRYVDDILSGSGVDIDLQFAVPSYDIVDLRASLITPSWRVDLFADNATDEFAETRVFNTFFFLEPRPFSIVLPKRRLGVRLSYQF
ncbi:MAG: TonB-dependent receptor [Gammaproteobacteria bacterium]